MNCGGAFIFDPESEAALREVWQVVAQAGGSNTMLGLDYPPHLTFWMDDQMDQPALKAGFETLAAACQPVEIRLAALGVFPGESGVVYLAPVANQALLDLHARYYAVVEQCSDHLSGYYRPGVWVPHITVGYGLTPEAIGAVVTVLSRTVLPKKVCITGLTFGCFNITGSSQLEPVWFGKE